jgi:steroid 5-alpha reductase family enzyme
MASTSLLDGFLTTLWLSGVVVVATMSIAFVTGRALARYRDIDIFWPLGFVGVALAGFFVSGATHGTNQVQRWLLLTLTSLWGLRLSAYLAWRSRGHGEDPRYEAIMKRAKGSEVLYAAAVIYGLQAVLMWFVSLALSAGMFAPSPLVVLEIIGTLVWGVGFFFESIGDLQLYRFSTKTANSGKLLDTGLWAWTRHPNYFGDATVWWGLFLIAAAGGWGALSVLSPLVMTGLLTSISGKALTEKRMNVTRPGFEAYVARTSGFFPLPPRRP